MSAIFDSYLDQVTSESGHMINREWTKTLQKKKRNDTRIIASYMLCMAKVTACLRPCVIAEHSYMS